MLIEVKKMVNETVDIKNGTYYRAFMERFAKIIINGDDYSGIDISRTSISGYITRLELIEYFGENSQEITEETFLTKLNEKIQWITKI